MGTIPKTLGAIIDRAATVRARRLELEKKVKALKAEQSDLEQAALAQMRKAHVEKSSGRIATFSWRFEEIGIVEDWESVWTWIRTNDRMELLQKRLNQGEYRAVVEEYGAGGSPVAGAYTETRVVTSLTKK